MTARTNKRTDVDEAIATLIACTRRKRRPKSILEVADLIEFLRQVLGSYEAVSDTVGVSTEMLREFRSVNRLDDEVKSLVKDRTIDSVDLVYRISKLDPAIQRAVVREVLDHRMIGDDVRVVRSFARGKPGADQNAVERAMRSRDVRTYLIRFPLPVSKKARDLRNTFEGVVGDDGIVSFDIKEGIVTVGLTYRGQRVLRDAAKRAGLSLRKFVTGLLQQPGNKR